MNDAEFNPSSSPAAPFQLTGLQEHYLKRELISLQTQAEVSSLDSPKALCAIGPPFRSDHGMESVAPQETPYPILRYVFANHARTFPFLERVDEKEFWQDGVQVFLETFTERHISSMIDRREETKRHKMSRKLEKVLDLMMVSGIKTTSGLEERVQGPNVEFGVHCATDQGLVVNSPDVRVNEWEVNIVAVRTVATKKLMRTHQHSQYIIRVTRGSSTCYVGRRFSEFADLLRRLRASFPAKVLPHLPKKNKTSSSFAADLFSYDVLEDEEDDDVDLDDDKDDASTSSFDTRSGEADHSRHTSEQPHMPGSRPISRSSGGTNKRPPSSISGSTLASRQSDQTNSSMPDKHVTLHQERQRISLRAFLRTLLQDRKLASSQQIQDFLTARPIPRSDFNAEEILDMKHRRRMDQRRILEQKRFYEIARNKARELDSYMSEFRRSIVEKNGLSQLFREIKEKNAMSEMGPEYQKFFEWLRIEVAVTLYQLFLAEDNSPELFAQTCRMHTLIPYSFLKYTMRVASPTAVMSAILDLFLAQPFGSRSLLQRMLGMAMGDGIAALQRGIGILEKRISTPPQGNSSDKRSSHHSGKMDIHPLLCRLNAFIASDEATKTMIREQAEAEGYDIIITISMIDAKVLLAGHRSSKASLKHNPLSTATNKGSGWFGRATGASTPHVTDLDMSNELVTRVFNGYAAWAKAIEDEPSASSDSKGITDLQSDAVWFAWLKELLRMMIRQRDKYVMMGIIDEPVTMSLIRDLFTIFYEPLVRAYKSANVFDSISDFSEFVDDAIQVIKHAQNQDMSADPNQTVQSLIDLCTRHQEKFFAFVHKVHSSDNGLFHSLMVWIEDILAFLRNGPKGGGKFDMNGIFNYAVTSNIINGEACLAEINALVHWQEARRRWHYEKTREKVPGSAEHDNGSGDGDHHGAAPGSSSSDAQGFSAFRGSDFGLNDVDLEDLAISDSSDHDGSQAESESGDEAHVHDDPIAAERKRRQREIKRAKMRVDGGEPVKPETPQIETLRPEFANILTAVLAP